MRAIPVKTTNGVVQICRICGSSCDLSALVLCADVLNALWFRDVDVDLHVVYNLGEEQEIIRTTF